MGNSKPGPKPYNPTKTQRSRVKLYIAGGMTEPAIAAVLGICQDTLRKHFTAELSSGRAAKLAENLARLEKAADGGNVSAMKHLDAKFVALQAGAPSRGEKIGKKDQAEAIAQTAGGEGSEWGDDLMTPGHRPN